MANRKPLFVLLAALSVEFVCVAIGHRCVFSAQPNVVVIMADDCTYNDLAMYGGKNARTPNLDRLAQQGLVFERAFLSEAMCQPCRAELYSGQFPVRPLA